MGEQLTLLSERLSDMDQGIVNLYQAHLNNDEAGVQKQLAYLDSLRIYMSAILGKLRAA